MKKVLSLILALALCLSLCACGGAGSVKKALRGEWVAVDGGLYTFSNGRFTCETVDADLNIGAKEGRYKISKDTIKLSYEDGTTAELKFTDENGVLSINGLVEQSRIDEALQGHWKGEKTPDTYTSYTFENGHISAETVILGNNLGADEGSYVILGNVIVLRFADGTSWKLNYTYKNGTLTLDDLVKE